jgi:methionyl-tRNA formyltransferase
MRVAIVTSEITFVPENYAPVVEGLADHKSVAGLIIITNRSLKILFQAIVMILTFSAPRLGSVLLHNWLFPRTKARTYRYKRFGKFIYLVKDINSVETQKILKKEKIDLVLNARTRSIYKQEILGLPPLGCYNIHHGILPYQRGVFCDFWAHYDQTGAGFSIHKMTSKLDDGDIIISYKVNSAMKNYIEYLMVSARQERKVCIEFLNQLEREKTIKPLHHIKTFAIQYRKNPGLKDFYALQSRGIRI